MPGALATGFGVTSAVRERPLPPEAGSDGEGGTAGGVAGAGSGCDRFRSWRPESERASVPGGDGVGSGAGAAEGRGKGELLRGEGGSGAGPTTVAEGERPELLRAVGEGAGRRGGP